MTIPDKPTRPTPRPGISIPEYYPSGEVTAMIRSYEARDAALVAEIDRLKASVPQPTGPVMSRFAGDPGPGKAIFGVAPGQDSRTSLIELEKTVGGPLAFRQYHGGSADFAVPNGVLAKAVQKDHAEGRIPVISPKPGLEQLADHMFETQMVAFFKWLEAQPGITIVIVHHEGENDWKADFNNLEAYKLHQNTYRLAQRWVRQCITKAAGANPKKIVFIGSLLSYSWSKQGRAKFGDPEGWNPGKREDGRHIWDVACLDHYQPSYTGTTLETQQWIDATKSIKSWGTLLGITENGVNWGNKNGGKILGAFIKRFVEFYDGVIYLYFSSSAGPGGKIQENQSDWWTLSTVNGSLDAFVSAYQKYNYNPMAKKV